METSITSHLLAALNLPPLRDVAPYHDSDRPLPLEPSASQDPYAASRRSMAPPQQNGQHHENHQDAELQDEIPTQVAPAYPPIFTPPQAADPALQQQQQHQLQLQQQHQPPAPPQTHPQLHQPPPPQTPTNATPSQRPESKKKTSTNRRARRKWTEEETNDLIVGCHEHGVGNWKKVLDDPRFNFNGRSSVDLKDRFRTCFPKEYRKDAMIAEDPPMNTPPGAVPDTSQPVAGTPSGGRRARRKVTKTEIHHAGVLERLGIEGHFPKVQRRERREFTAEEDRRLLQGFTVYGASWSRIQNDPALNLHHRRSTDLRDRFRNAFPDRYEQAGFKARPRQPRARTSPTPEREDGSGEDNDEEAEQDGHMLHQHQHQQTVDPAMEEAAKADSTAFIVQSLLNEHLAANWVDPNTSEVITPMSHAPAPGSLALDPALNMGFEGSALEQLTNDLLAAAENKESQRNGGDVVRWEDMAAVPIFEVETSFSKRLADRDGTKPAVVLNANTSPRSLAPKKRYSEPEDQSVDKKPRLEEHAGSA